MALTREQFEALRPDVKEVSLVDTDETVYIRTITARMREDFDNGVTKDTPNLSARLVVLCLCDEAGAPMYPMPDDANREEWLAATAARVAESDVPSRAIEQLFFDCRDHNRMGKRAVEDAVKNSNETPAVSSSTS